MTPLGCIPARIYVSLPSDDPDEAQAVMQQLADELDRLDILDADVALFATHDGRIRPDLTQPFAILTGAGGVQPLPARPVASAGYSVRLAVSLAPLDLSPDEEAVLVASGLIGEHAYLFPDCANAVEACERAEACLRDEWAAIPGIDACIVIDAVMAQRREHPERAPLPAPRLPQRAD